MLTRLQDKSNEWYDVIQYNSASVTLKDCEGRVVKLPYKHLRLPKDDQTLHESKWHAFKIETVLLGGVVMRLAFYKDRYVGDPALAMRLWRKYGVREFHLRNASWGVATIGWNPTDKKWFGWSHRAICGFSIGDKLFPSEVKTIRTLKQAREAASNFAEDCS